MLSITNTLSCKKELFKPQHQEQVSMYVCGITPYDYAHLGHGRCYVTFDVLYRLLSAMSYQVTYCRNFTDIDDKIINRAKHELGDQNLYLDIANKYIDAFKQDIGLLNCTNPSIEPRVTQTIPEIIEFIQGLIKAGKAYEIDGDVYYRIAHFPSYGALSKQKLDELRAGARVELNDKKRDPLDFALWKSEPEGHFWQSPWGWGRPGWHIECSAMAAKYLGKTIDIHGGGMDLTFPHHENEIAQSEGLFEQPLARYWVHNGFVRINQVKMSKSLGNFFTLRQLYEQFDPMVIRFYFLNHQYKAPLEFSLDDLHVMHKTYQRLCKSFVSEKNIEISDLDMLNSATVQSMMTYLYDDMNTPGMLGVLFESLPALRNTDKDFFAVKKFLNVVLGLPLKLLPEASVELTPDMQLLIDEREKARVAKDFKRADELRDQLKKMGYDVQDKKIK
ncbi:cysteine--tRNA ligase [Candidatus Dependentiae bacterium Noda2021]|nr:cysteine--tRNA ligase [Candidatus Dependentiae bacterium Noda2021]